MTEPRPRLSSGEYLAWERKQLTKHEYHRGEVFAMAGASVRHNRLCSVLNRLLDERLAGRGCHVLTSDQRVVADGGERYVYPDVSVVCGTPSIEDDDVLTNPTVLVEVLSLSTEQNDRGSKWQSYQQIGSLEDYVLVPQWSPRIEHFRRDDDGSWSYRAVGRGGHIVLASGAQLAVDEVFADVMELPGDPPPLTTVP